MPLDPFALEPAVRELRERSRVPGVAVGLLIDGEARFASDGVTNVDHPLPVDETTLFQIASLTKPFTATALLRLASEGKLDVEAPVRSVLPEFRLPREEWTDRIRIRDLLTHRNGWAGDRFFIRPARERTLAGLVAEFADNEQLAPPGAVYSYDNAAFCVAGRVVEVASGLPYPEALRRLVLAPLELDRTFLRADQVVTHRVAAPHVVGASGPHVLRGGGWQPGWQLQDFDLPAGGLISCTRDLLRWARFQLGDGRAPDGTALLPREALLRMQTETHGAGCNDDAGGSRVAPPRPRRRAVLRPYRSDDRLPLGDPAAPRARLRARRAHERARRRRLPPRSRRARPRRDARARRAAARAVPGSPRPSRRVPAHVARTVRARERPQR